MFALHTDRLPLKAISWLLMVTVFVLTVQPMHVHLEHVDDASSLIHEHAIDLHFEVDNIAPANHDGAVVFSVTPDVTLKKFSDNLLLVALFTCFSLLLWRLAHDRRQRPTSVFILPGWGLFAIKPPLRAPPRA